jgi:TonB-linked SusC/RagA family outer membrane protein
MAQERTVTGTVTSEEEGTPIPGVNVILKGTSVGTVTDIDGNYSINVPGNGGTLVFSFIGLATEEVNIGGQSVINMVMTADIKQLTEVVVVAYGESSAKSLTSSVGEIDNDVIKNQQVVSVARTLQGTVPGVNIITGSGQPGQNPTIRIRGISSINSSSDPLIVLDGAVYTGNLNTIDPNEIETISVLKDAAASALYGARAASGVILITSKRGKAGETRFNFKASAGVSERAVNEYPFITASEQMQLEWETLFNSANLNGNPNPGQFASDNLLNRVQYNPYGGIDSPIGPDGNLIAGKTLQWETDWENALLQNGTRQDYALNVAGGNENVQYFVSGSYLQQDGIVINSDFERFSGRANIDAKLNDWLNLGVRQSVSSSNQNFPVQSGNSFSNNVQYIRTMSSIYPIYRRDVNGDFVLDEAGERIFDDGQEAGQPINDSRPVLQPSNALAQTTLDRDITNRFFNTSNIFLEASFLKYFTFKTSFTYNKYIFDNQGYTNPEIGSARNVNGRLTRDRNITNEWTITNSLNFDYDINSKNRINVLLLQEAYDYNISTISVSKTGIPFGGLYQLNSAASLETINGLRNAERISSLMARAEYSFNDKVFVQGSLRRDLSSRFTPESREGVFYSISGSWVLTDENFMKGSQNVVSFLKLRASYGELGNAFIIDNFNNQVYFPGENVFETGWDQLATPGVYIGPLRNSSITWETSAITNVGLDFGFAKDAVTGSIDAYIKDTKGLIFARPLANSAGVRQSQILENIGNMRNSGIEVQLNWKIIDKKDFLLSLGGNISFEKNEITELPQEELVTGSFKYSEGVSVYEFFIEEWAGVSAETGAPMWYEDVLDGEGEVIDRDTTLIYGNASASRQYFGTALPWARGGINPRLQYKGFDFSALLYFSLGGQILDTDYQGLMEGGLRPGNQKHRDILNRWQNPGDLTDVPRLDDSNQGGSRSTRFLFDATYGRLRNVTLGYTLPKSVTERAGIKSLRVYVQGDNLLTFFGREGLDPEQSINGITNDRSSVFKTVSGGVEITL